MPTFAPFNHSPAKRSNLQTPKYRLIRREVSATIPIGTDSKTPLNWKNAMQSKFATVLIAACAVFSGASASFNAQAQSEVSALSALSAMPIASVVGAASVGASTVVAVPLALSTAGAVLVVQSVAIVGASTVYVLKSVSDGAVVSVEILGRGASGASLAVGTVATVSVIGAGTLLSVAGEVIAFIPNALGRALMHNERVTP